MSKIFVPSSGPEDWRGLLADPEKHWARQYSARTLAHCWENADGFPPEVQAVLKQNPLLATAVPLLIFPEWKVSLPGGSRSSQNDAWVLAKNETDLVSITVEGKVNEPFDRTVAEWKADASPGKERRLAFLLETLGLTSPIPDSIRYQLLHRTASAIIEAKRFGAKHAVMLVHSFSKTDAWYSDFDAFVALFGQQSSIGNLVSTSASDGLPLYFAWVHGEERFLNA